MKISKILAHCAAIVIAVADLLAVEKSATPLAADDASLLLLHFDELQNGSLIVNSSNNGEGAAETMEATSEEMLLTSGATNYGKALQCDGQGALLKVPLSTLRALAKPSEFSIEFMIFPESLGDSQNPKCILMAGQYPGPGAVFGLSVAGPDTLHWARYAGGGWKLEKILLEKPIETGVWQWVALTFRQDSEHTYELEVFLNGEKVATLSLESPLGGIRSDNWLYVGGCGIDNRNFIGQIDELHISDVERKISLLQSGVPAVHPQNSISAAPRAAPRSDAGVGHPADAWTEAFYPYRLEVKLKNKVSGRIQIQASLDSVIAELQKICPEKVDVNSFAFEKVLLVNPSSGKRVGGYFISPETENLLQNTGFSKGKDGNLLSWKGFDAKTMRLNMERIGGQDRPVLEVARDAIANTFLSQEIKLKKENFYLLTAWLNQEGVDAGITFDIVNPLKKLFLSTTGSYLKPILPRGKWTEIQTLYHPDMENASVRIGTAFIGKGAIASPSIRKVQWDLLADLPQATDRLWLYYVPRAGHRLTVPEDALVLRNSTSRSDQPAEIAGSQSANLNPEGVALQAGGHSVWTIPSAYPLKAGYLEKVMPRQSAARQQVRVFQGGADTVIVAVKTNTPQLSIDKAISDIPLEVRFERIAPIPVYDGPYPAGRLQEIRYDALMACDDPLMPPAPEGIHLIAVTFKASKDTAPGSYEGTIRLGLQDQVPQRFEVEIPLQVTVAPLFIKPMRHFGAVFGAQHFQLKLSAKNNPFMAGSGVSIADFHGYSGVLPGKATALGDESSNQRSLIGLSRKYFKKMLDYDLVPQGPTLYCPYTYSVKDENKDKAPLLENWNFEEYDTGIDELVLKKDAPWLFMFHSNGQQMDRLRLSNGVTYSFREPQGNVPWKQLSKGEFYSLIGNFFDAIATHLDEKGVLDRAVFLVDESDPSTYETIRDYINAVRLKPAAAKIKFAHTAYKPATYTKLGKDGRPALDGLFDIPMPDNDDHFNLFDPESSALLKTRGKDNWVYYVESDHLDLINAGLSTLMTPLKLNHFGVNGWYCWAAFLWSMPYPIKGAEFDGEEFTSGPVTNPWLNPFYHHGPGGLSFFYPPNPSGVPNAPTDQIVPSYRLSLMRDGIQALALLKVMQRGIDDNGNKFFVNASLLKEAEDGFAAMCAQNPVQWYPSIPAYQTAVRSLYRALNKG